MSGDTGVFTLLDVGLGLQADGDSPTVRFIVECDQDTEGVTVRDLIVDEALQVNCLQLEVDGDVDQPIGGGLGEGRGPVSVTPILG